MSDIHQTWNSSSIQKSNKTIFFFHRKLHEHLTTHKNQIKIKSQPSFCMLSHSLSNPCSLQNFNRLSNLFSPEINENAIFFLMSATLINAMLFICIWEEAWKPDWFKRWRSLDYKKILSRYTGKVMSLYMENNPNN